VKGAIKARQSYKYFLQAALLAFLVTSLLACASTQTSKLASATLLWKIEKQNTQTSYLFGTIHSEDKRVLRHFLKNVLPHLRNSKQLLVEVIPDEASIQNANQRMFFTNDDRLQNYLSPELFRTTVEQLKVHGLDKHEINMMKPWAAFTLLSMPPAETGVFLDIKLMQMAKQENLQMHALETMSEQIDVFDNMPLKAQVSILESTLNLNAGDKQWLDATINAWLSNDLDRVSIVGEQYFQQLRNEDALLLRTSLIDQRNKKMAKNALSHLQDGNVFIAVGALHLPGKSGLVQLFRNEGYTLTPEANQ